VIAAPSNSINVKQLGAYYTHPQVADFLVGWAVRSRSDRVIDPSFGGGVFLRAAAERIRALRGDPSSTVYGIELDHTTFQATAQATATHVFRENLRQDDFFSSASGLQGAFQAVVGNPPFIRYQQFAGAARERAIALMRTHNVHLSELASSWASFVIGSSLLLRRNGRLAMVVPMEICHASYGLSVLSYLCRSFGSLQFLSFEEPLFPELNQDTLLLLADVRGGRAAEIRWRHFRNLQCLHSLTPARPFIPRTRILDANQICQGEQRLITQFLPPRAKDLYAELRQLKSVVALGSIAEVGIGYVTGGNDFFHLSATDLKQWEIPPSLLRRAVCRGRALSGLRFTTSDWSRAYIAGDAANLLELPCTGSIPPNVMRYLRFGESNGVHLGYKCRSRTPWYHVPHVYKADGFLTYMSGLSPRLVANDADSVAPNTLHIVRMRNTSPLDAHRLAATWQTSLTQLSAEVEGHAMGGGLLKLEPREAARVLIATPLVDDDLLVTLDPMIRDGHDLEVQASVDRAILRNGLGLSERDCRTLREAIKVLRSRRLQRGQ